MELSPRQQATELISKSQTILILLADPDGDAVGGAIALFLVFKKLGKEVNLVCSEKISSYLKFLPRIEIFTNKFSGARDFIITLNTSQVLIDKLGYKKDDGKVHLVITPKSGSFSKKDITLAQGSYNYDLIIVLDCADLDLLGKLFDENAAMFYETPLLNIDHHVSNDQFGKVNLVDMMATSTCEILVSLIESLEKGEKLIDEDIATTLLTGITADTGSFQNANTTPKSFTVAAQLIAAGARQQEIIKNLFKTKPLSTLRLWGRILAGIREDKEYRLVWSYALARDLEQTGATEGEISGAIDELLSSAPNGEIVFLISERDDGIHLSIRTTKNIDAVEVANLFGGGGHPGASGAILPRQQIAQAEKEILTKIRDFQAARLGLPKREHFVSQYPEKTGEPEFLPPEVRKNKDQKDKWDIPPQK
jgi:phosphoesterase RecJ-like protein